MPASSKIRYPAIPEVGVSVSEGIPITIIEVLNSTLNILGSLADTIEQSKARIDKQERLKFCHALVDGANELTAQCDIAVKASKRKRGVISVALRVQPAPPSFKEARNQIIAQLESPLNEVLINSTNNVNLQDWEPIFLKLLTKMKANLQHWLDVARGKIKVPESDLPPNLIPMSLYYADQKPTSQVSPNQHTPDINPAPSQQLTSQEEPGDQNPPSQGPRNQVPKTKQRNCFKDCIVQ